MIDKRLVLIFAALAPALLSCGCGPPSDAPTLADQRRPELARRAGLGQEVELTKRVEVLRGLGGYYDLRAFENYTSGRHLGYLPPGTRLRTEHVWYVPPEDGVGVASGVVVTMRVLPEHPLDGPLKPMDLPTNWVALPTGERANAYVLPASHGRIVEGRERTPEDQVVPLTERQEWPPGWRR